MNRAPVLLALALTATTLQAQASDGAEALLRWHQQNQERYEQQRLEQRKAEATARERAKGEEDPCLPAAHKEPRESQE